MKKKWSNITLIGMPASGKSTIGVLLAKRLGYQFIDTDLLIQQEEGCLLKDIIAKRGLAGFMEVENRVNSQVRGGRAVIAPGGSVVYEEEAMEHLREIGMIVYLKLSYEAVAERLGNLVDRGVVLKDGMTLKDLYDERVPLYEKYADITVDEAGKNAGDVVDWLRNLAESNIL
ncbi:MAG: shikimate kinase [Lachnospiraceae bacterium]|nr:shikimate kinase [Lachnospiraceae bacterium]